MSTDLLLQFFGGFLQQDDHNNTMNEIRCFITGILPGQALTA